MRNDNDNTSVNDRKIRKSDRIHKFFFHNTGIKICSIILAIIVWAVIINIDDPYKTRSFNVEVETINENALKSVNKVYEIIEGSSAIVKVKGKKSVVDKLETTDIRATADLSNLSAVNAVAIQPSLRKLVSSDVTLTCEQVLKVSLEDRDSKQVKVTVVANGTPGEGYTLGECTAKPNMVEVAGGESAIDQISSVRVFLNVNGATEDFAKKLTPVAYDEDGNKVESSTLSFSNNFVRVFAQILEDKTVPVRVKITGEPASGYQYVSTDCLPEEVEIAGTSRKLSNISEVVIPIDITGMTSSSSKLEQDINISDYLPVGVSPVEEFEMISIRITIEQLIKKNIEIAVSSINFSSLESGLDAEILEDVNVINLLISGRATVLNEITSGNANAYINCKGLSEGVYTLPVLLGSLDESCTILDSTKLKIRIAKRKSATEPPRGTQNPQTTQAPAETQKPDVNISTETPVPTESTEEEGTEEEEE